MKYLKAFDNHEDYNDWTLGQGDTSFIRPSVGYCINENEVHFNGKIGQYVNLGLPSGTLWATENLKDGNGNDLYFAWGETQGYTADQIGTDKYFAWEGDNADYKYGVYDSGSTPNYGMTKYNVTDNLTVLEPDDDAATVLWGENWCIPTEEQFQELINNTTTSWTTQNGIDGMLFTSIANGNTLFFPALGGVDNGNFILSESIRGYYWSCYGKIITALHFIIDSGNNVNVSKGDRYVGFSVRPVRYSLSMIPDPIQ